MMRDSTKAAKLCKFRCAEVSSFLHHSSLFFDSTFDSFSRLNPAVLAHNLSLGEPKPEPELKVKKRGASEEEETLKR